jgi:heat shock protein HslJ
MTQRFLLLAALPLLVACGGQAAPAPKLEGTKWRFVVIDGAKPVSDRAGAEFLPERIAATAGCNGVGGAWKIAGGRIEAEGWVSTMMYCEGLMEQEMALGMLFQGKPSYRIQGDRLFLKSDAHSAELVRQ